MTKRRKRPAPPLVLNPVFGRYPVGGSQAARLRELGAFLRRRQLLTDGGEKSLARGLVGRNDVVSLGLQDVRAHAHGLARDLLRLPSDRWEEHTEEYFLTYDKGKPRRPTHLQRLYLEWSNDLSWPGLLRASRRHPSLQPQIELALSRLEDPSTDKTMLTLALQCQGHVAPLLTAFEQSEQDRADLLRLLPLLPADRFKRRLPWLAGVASRFDATRAWGFEMIRACHVSFPDARALRSIDFDRLSLERASLAHLGQENFDPVFVSAFRSFLCRRETLEHLFAAISAEDPLRRAVFGPRPGRLWLEVQKAEMLSGLRLSGLR